MKKEQQTNKKNVSAIISIVVLVMAVAAGLFYLMEGKNGQNDQQMQNVIETTAPATTEATNPMETSKAEMDAGTEENVANPIADEKIFEESEFSRVLPEEGKLNVLVFDIGKGDSIFIQMPNGKNILMDTGTPDYWDRLQGYLSELGVTKIDALIATHPHQDHIGSMTKILKNYDVQAIYMTRAEHTSKTYKKLLETIQSQNKKVIELKAGKTIDLDPSVQIDVLAPLKEYEDLNDTSAVLHMQYGNTSMLFTGDAEKESEMDMVDAYQDGQLKADVLKVGHHGSKTSTKKKFLQAVSPKDAIISTAQGNEYNHPHQVVLDRLAQANIHIYRTDLNSTVGVFFDKDNYEIRTAYIDGNEK